MAGRKMQPLSVIEAKGVTHLTKAEKEERRTTEAQAKGAKDKIRPPTYTKEYWTARERKHFKELANELLELDIIFNLDVDTLVQYIDTRMQYIDIMKVLREIQPAKPKFNEKTGEITDMIAQRSYGSLQRNKDLVIRQMMSLASDLGLTLSSRLKLIIPKHTEKPKSKFDRFGSGGR